MTTAFTALPYTLGFALPLVVLLAAAAAGWWTAAPLPFIVGGLAVLDAWVGDRRDNPGADAARLDGNPWFRVVTWAWVPYEAWFLWHMLAGAAGDDWTRGERLALAIGVGLCTGTVGITYAHELVHRRSRWERALGEALLTMVAYPHFAIAHVLGHHRTVATPRDPQTARGGESFYRFLPRAVGGSLASALRLEAERVRRRHGTSWSLRNRFWRYALVQVVLWMAVARWFGVGGLSLMGVQAAVAIAQLEVTNYIEHYGLRRRETAPGVYEAAQPWHSWDHYARVSNWLLLNLARHADHHQTASRRYPRLETQARAPELPAGYPAMFAAALVPPLWFRLMDPRVATWRARHLAETAPTQAPFARD